METLSKNVNLTFAAPYTTHIRNFLWLNTIKCGTSTEMVIEAFEG